MATKWSGSHKYGTTGPSSCHSRPGTHQQFDTAEGRILPQQRRKAFSECREGRPRLRKSWALNSWVAQLASQTAPRPRQPSPAIPTHSSPCCDSHHQAACRWCRTELHTGSDIAANACCPGLCRRHAPPILPPTIRSKWNLHHASFFHASHTASCSLRNLHPKNHVK